MRQRDDSYAAPNGTLWRGLERIVRLAHVYAFLCWCRGTTSIARVSRIDFQIPDKLSAKPLRTVGTRSCFDYFRPLVPWDAAISKLYRALGLPLVPTVVS